MYGAPSLWAALPVEEVEIYSPGCDIWSALKGNPARPYPTHISAGRNAETGASAPTHPLRRPHMIGSPTYPPTCPPCCPPCCPPPHPPTLPVRLSTLYVHVRGILPGRGALALRALHLARGKQALPFKTVC
jgi:hypothetical protein